MSYYDRWDDRNREAKKRGERDAERGYRSHRMDYDSFTERGAAYEDGYREERNRLNRMEEERHEQERQEREAEQRQIEREREWIRQAEEEEYNRMMEEQQCEEEEVPC